MRKSRILNLHQKLKRLSVVMVSHNKIILGQFTPLFNVNARVRYISGKMKKTRILPHMLFLHCLWTVRWFSFIIIYVILTVFRSCSIHDFALRILYIYQIGGIIDRTIGAYVGLFLPCTTFKELLTVTMVVVCRSIETFNISVDQCDLLK